MASELISPSQLRASTTDQTASGNWIGGHHSIDNVKEVSPNDQFDHLTLWQSEFDPNCAKQQIFADWSSLGPQTVSNFTILYTTKSAGVPTRVTLKPPGSLRDVTNQIACKNYTVTKNDNKRVQQVDCVLRAPIASTVASGIIFTFQPRPLSLTPTLSYCQIGIYEMRVYGDSAASPSPQSASSSLSAGGIVGVVLASITAVGIFAVLRVRARNLSNRKEAKRITGYSVVDGGWRRLLDD